MSSPVVGEQNSGATMSSGSGSHHFPSVASYDAWVPQEFTDDLLLAEAQQPLCLTPEEERLFQSFGDGLETDLECSLSPSDGVLDEKQAVYAEAHAAGLFKGGIRRAAFSMGDLQALQPTIPVSQAHLSHHPRSMLGTPGMSKAPRLESVPESKALSSPSSDFLSSNLPGEMTMSAEMLEHLALDSMPSGLGSSGLDPHYGVNFGQPSGLVPGSDLAHVDLAMTDPMIKLEPRISGGFASNDDLNFAGGLEGFDPRFSYSQDFGQASHLPNEPAGGLFDLSYMDVDLGDKRPPLAPKSASSKLKPTSTLPNSDSNVLAKSQQNFKEIPDTSKVHSGVRVASNSAAESKQKGQQQQEKSSGRSSKPLHRSQSALELRSMSRPLPSTGPTGEFRKSKFTVELTTPEGHTYTAGRLSNEERAQKILRYRQKRHERNFNKRIKYMCRKTLADSRPRVRGRFARNDDAAAVMPHETKKALAEKAKRERKAAEAAAAEYLREQDRLAGRFPPTFHPYHTPLANTSFAPVLDYKDSRKKMTSDLSDLVPTSIPHVDSDPNLSTSTACDFPRMPFNTFTMHSQEHSNL